MALVENIYVLNSKVSLIDYESALATFERWIKEKSQRYVCVANVHTLMMGTEDPAFQKVTNDADMVTPDGQPLRWVANLRGAKLKDRVYGPTLMEKTCQRFQKGYSHFFYGAGVGVPETLKEVLTCRFPKLSVTGTYSPPFRRLTPNEDEQITNKINTVNPDFLWVGLGAPKQEFWMAENLGKVNARIMIGVGAAFDFLTGRVPQAPPWMQRHGLEWLFRLMKEPRRLAYRYLIHNPLFLVLVLLQLSRPRRHPIS